MRHFRAVTALILITALLLTGCSFGKNKVKDEERQGLMKILDEISAELHPATAGNTLVAARLAAELIEWAKNTTMDKKEAAGIVGNWLKEQTPEIREAFEEQLSGVAGAFGSIVKDGAAGLLESAGVEKDLSNLGSRLKELVDAVLASGGID